MSELEDLVKSLYNHGLSEEEKAKLSELIGDPELQSEDLKAYRQHDLAKLFERDGQPLNRITIFRWKKGNPSPLGCNLFDGYWIGPYYVTTLRRLDSLGAWISLVNKVQKKRERSNLGTFEAVVVGIPTYLRTEAPRGNETVTMDDFYTVEVRNLGKCIVLFKNRGWLGVVDNKDKLHRVQVPDILDGELPPGEFWPIEDPEEFLDLAHKGMLGKLTD